MSDDYSISVGGVPEEVYHISVTASESFHIRGDDGYSMIEQPKTILKPSATSSELLKKINSNTDYKKFKVVSKNSYRSSNPEYLTHVFYLMEEFNGAEYSIPQNSEGNKYLPLRGINVSISDATKQYLMKIRDQYVKERNSMLKYNHYNDHYFNSVSEQIEDMRQNYKNFVLAYANSSLRAGVSPEQVYEDLVNYLGMTGVDKDTWVRAYYQEMGTELTRGAYEQAEQTECCIDYLENYNYASLNESFDSYKQRAYKMDSFRGVFDFLGIPTQFTIDSI